MNGSTSIVHLDAWQLALAAGLVLLCGLASVALGLRLEKQLAIASVRTVAQLLLVGYVLVFVFHIHSLWMLLPVFAVMIGVASHAAVARSSRTFPGIFWRSFVTLTLSGLLTTFAVTAAIIQVEPWYRPQYVIPLLGMILGNALTGISLCLDQLLETLAEKRNEVENELALGASRWEAARAPLASAIRLGMVPNINSMMVVGIVSLPGMMTGQILAGVNPMEAVKYQIVVMFMIAAATTAGCVLIALLAYHRLFNERHQLNWQLISRSGREGRGREGRGRAR